MLLFDISLLYSGLFHMRLKKYRNIKNFISSTFKDCLFHQLFLLKQQFSKKGKLMMKNENSNKLLFERKI